MESFLEIKTGFSVGLIVINALIFGLSLQNSRQNKFFGDTHLLAGLGIYVWGDGLVLAPFWIISAITFFFLSWKNIATLVLLFFIFRSGFEIIYWLNHQSAKKDYLPPLFRRFKWINSEQSAILYQVMHTCLIVWGVFLLLLNLQN